MLRNRADWIRGQLTNVVESDRFPFKSLQESSQRAAEVLTELDKKATEGNFFVKLPNG